MRGLPLFVLAAVLLLLLARTADASVVVFPLDPRGVAYDTAQAGTTHVLETLRGVTGLKVIEPKSVEAELGVNLTAQAQKCEYDVFCLVEIGEILRGDRVLIGHLRQRGEGEERVLELKLIVLDVLKATIVEVLIWEVEPGSPRALRDVTRAAVRKLFAAPDVQVVWNIEPPNAKLALFGDPFTRPASDQPTPFWSGAYVVRVVADGYHPIERRIIIPKKRRGTISVDLALEQDPLYVAQRKSSGEVNPFDKSSRRDGTGVSAQVVGAVKDDDGEPSPYLNPLAWGVVGAGTVLGVVGGLLMNGAQSRYNQLSEQERFTLGVTVPAAVAIQQREDERGAFRVGTITLGVGVIVALGGVAWMIIDATMFSTPPEAKNSSKLSHAPVEQLDPSTDQIAADWAAALYGGAR